MPRSATLASSIVASSGGPGSAYGEASGKTSALTTRRPLSGVSGNGVPRFTLTPAINSVFPSLTLAEPSAFSIMPGVTVRSLTSSKPRPSSLLPFPRSSFICDLLSCSTTIVFFTADIDLLFYLLYPIFMPKVFSNQCFPLEAVNGLAPLERIAEGLAKFFVVQLAIELKQCYLVRHWHQCYR